MLVPIFILCLSHFILATPVKEEFDVEDIEKVWYHFNDFKMKYNKSYASAEEELRFYYFKENLAKINELNRKNPLTDFGINKFADLSPKEVQNLLSLSGVSIGDDYDSCSTGVASDIKTGSVYGSIDWREKNAVTPVQNQGLCGACRAFSASALLEGAYALKYRELLKVSEQQFVDCDTKSSGCRGGWMHSAISSTMELGGQMLKSDYPYIEKEQQCQFDVNKAVVKVTSCKVYPNITDADDKLAALVATAGPLSIALDASTFQNYNGGIMTDCDGSDINHGVALIGYAYEAGNPYWIIKNSWGSEWGEDGYMRIQKGVGCLSIGYYALTAEVNHTRSARAGHPYV